MMRTAATVLAAVVMAAAPVGTAPAPAQEVSVRVVGPRGWIGISYEYTRTALAGAEPKTTAVVTGVAADGPAARAGLQVGDTLMEVNGRPVTGSTFDRLALEPGDPIRLQVRRQGTTRTIELVAEERPATGRLRRVPSEIVIRVDSISTAILESVAEVDNVRFFPVDEPGKRLLILRDSLVGGDPLLDIRGVLVDSVVGARSLTFPRVRWEQVLIDPPGIGASDWVIAGGDWPGPQPFTAFVLRSEGTDSLLTERSRLRRDLLESRRQEIQRQRELANELAEEQERIDRSDPDLQRLRSDQEQIRERIRELEEELTSASRREMLRRRPPADSQVRGVFEFRDEAHRPDRPVSEFRFPAPHLVGQSVVAGAQLVPLNEGLAEYFQVEKGLMVAEVVPGSLAAEAGIVSGDVVTGVDGNAVSSIDELRRQLARRGPLTLTVVRRGSTLSVELRE